MTRIESGAQIQIQVLHQQYSLQVTPQQLQNLRGELAALQSQGHLGGAPSSGQQSIPPTGFLDEPPVLDSSGPAMECPFCSQAEPPGKTDITGLAVILIGGGAPQAPEFGKMKSFPTVPEVGGAPGDWPRQGEVIGQRTVGSRADQIAYKDNPWQTSDPALRDERIAVSWSMWQNPNVQYDSDRKMFFVEDTNGNKRDVASLDDVKKELGPGGLNADKVGTSGPALKKFFEERISNLGQSPAASGQAAASGRNQPAWGSEQMMDSISNQLGMMLLALIFGSQAQGN